MLPIKDEEFNIVIEFGDKILHFRPWKGKERRLITKMVDEEGFDYNKIYNILTYGCMQEQDVYLTEQEILYVMYNLKKESLEDVFLLTYVCSECSDTNVEVVDYNSILNPRLSEFKGITVGNITFNMGPIFNNPTVTNKINTREYINMSFTSTITITTSICYSKFVPVYF